MIAATLISVLVTPGRRDREVLLEVGGADGRCVGPVADGAVESDGLRRTRVPAGRHDQDHRDTGYQVARTHCVPPERPRVPKTDANVILRDPQEPGLPHEETALGYTLVTFHAHPDDESIATGGHDGPRQGRGTSRRARRRDPAASWASTRPTRSRPTRRSPSAASPRCTPRPRSWASTASSSSATATRAWRARPPTTTTDAFARADVDEAAARLAEILREEDADVLTVYDDHGGYGHPDHVQVHRVGVRAGRARGHEARVRVDDEPRLHPGG